MNRQQESLDSAQYLTGLLLGRSISRALCGGVMLTVGGRKRTEAEFATLLEEAGLRLSRVVPIVAPVCVLEAIPA